MFDYQRTTTGMSNVYMYGKKNNYLLLRKNGEQSRSAWEEDEDTMVMQ